MEQAIRGWNNIAKFFGVHPQTIQKRRKEMIEAGVLFYVKVGKTHRRMVCSFPSLLMAWATAKMKKGEYI